MTIVFLVVGALLVFGVAAVVLGREAARLAASPPRPVFDVDEAVVWIGDRLPESVAAQHSHAEVRRILHWSIEHLALLAAEDRVAEEDETFGYVLEQAAAAGEAWAPWEIEAVLDAQTEYLQAIGAAGPQEMPPDPAR